VQSALQAAGLDLSNLSVSSNSGIFTTLTYLISFTYSGVQGTTVQDMANYLNDALSSDVAVNLVFSGATGGQSFPGGAPGAGGKPSSATWQTYLLYGALAMIAALAVFGFSKGFGEGAAGDL
jgi:hypothetical protein